MNVLVIGASGATGQQLVPKLLAAGHTVTALARTEASVPQKGVKIVIGDARDAAAIDRAVQGQDAVIAAFGPRSTKKDDLAETLMRNLVAAMEKQGVRRLVNLSAWGASETKPYTKTAFKIIKALFLRHVFEDKERGEKILFASSLDYVNVSPGRLTNGAARGGVKVSKDGAGLAAWLTRADLADWMIAQLTDPTWVRKSPIVGY